MLQPALRRDKAEVEAGKVAVHGLFVAEVVEGILEHVERQPGDVQRLRQPAPDLAAILVAQRVAHAAGHGPRRVNAATAEHFDHLLPKAAQANPVTCDVRVLVDQPHDISFGRVAVHAEQQVRPAQVEEAQRVALHQLRPVHEPA